MSAAVKPRTDGLLRTASAGIRTSASRERLARCRARGFHRCGHCATPGSREYRGAGENLRQKAEAQGMRAQAPLTIGVQQADSDSGPALCSPAS
jgi:hypothetical protein